MSLWPEGTIEQARWVQAQLESGRTMTQVKEALVAQLDPAHDPQRLALGLDEFLRALQTLRNAPLHSPGLQSAFDAVDREWDRLLRGLRQGSGGGPALRDLCERSERLLQALDALTQVVQRSLQTLLS